MRCLSFLELGEAVEARFLDAAVFLGFVVARLWGNSRPFDYYVAGGNNKRPYRIQVKASRARSSKNGSGYQINCHHTESRRPYTSKEIDFVAGYVVPLKIWYIVPISELTHVSKFTVFPTVPNSRSKYERYRENWDLLRR